MSKKYFSLFVLVLLAGGCNATIESTDVQTEQVTVSAENQQFIMLFETKTEFKILIKLTTLKAQIWKLESYDETMNNLYIDIQTGLLFNLEDSGKALPFDEQTEQITVSAENQQPVETEAESKICFMKLTMLKDQVSELEGYDETMNNLYIDTETGRLFNLEDSGKSLSVSDMKKIANYIA